MDSNTKAWRVTGAIVSRVEQMCQLQMDGEAEAGAEARQRGLSRYAKRAETYWQSCRNCRHLSDWRGRLPREAILQILFCTPCFTS